METPVAEGIVLGGRYRLDRLLGSGGMAQVFDGRDVRLDRPVAIKLLRPELAADAGLRSRFEREAQAAARLSHPNVVAVFDAGEDAGRAYIIMERLGGESMADVLARGPMDLAWLRRMAADILAALGAAHSAGIIHRDIKPANILLGADGRGKVADFGIARVIEEREAAEVDRGLTATGTVIGTPAYLAPERAMGHPATPQSDLYSVGVVLYEALTGRKPFEGATPLAIAAAASHGPGGATDPTTYRPDADPALVIAIARAMAPDPAQRYASAAAMAAALRGNASPRTEVMPAGTVVASAAAGAASVARGPAGVGGPAGVAAPGALAETSVAGPAAGAGPALGDLPVGPGGTRRAPAGNRRPGSKLTPRGRRVRTGVAAAVMVLLAVVAIAALANQGGSTGGTAAQRTTATTAAQVGSTAPTSAASPTAAPATAPANIVASLLALAGQLRPTDGPNYRELVTGLARIAALPAIAQPGAATVLLNQATNWYKAGGLTDAAYSQAVALLTPLSAQPLAPATVPDKKKGGSGNGGD